MTKRLRHILTITLLLVFFTPTAVKVLDSAFHHHELFFGKTGKSTLHLFHRTCPIPGFTLSQFTVQKVAHQGEKLRHFTRLYLNYSLPLFSTAPYYSFLLRAPPLSHRYTAETQS
jgi:hypothetical protein